MQYNRDIGNSLLAAICEGRIETVREFINEYGLTYLPSLEVHHLHDLLSNAINYNQTEIFKLLFTNCAHVNSSMHFTTLLHFAVYKGNIEIIEMLLDSGIDVNTDNIVYKTPLDLAIAGKKMEVTELLLNRGASFTDTNNDVKTLFCAVMKGYLPLVENLLNRGVYVDSVYSSTTSDWNGCTPLCFAVINGSEETTKLLLCRGANINARGSNGSTPLHIAAELGHLRLVVLLLENGAHVDGGFTSSECRTPLSIAVDSGHEEIVTLLLENGAKIDAEPVLRLVEEGVEEEEHSENNEQYCPYVKNESYRSNPDAAIYSRGKRWENVELLLQFGSSVEPENINGYKLLHTAVANGNLRIVEELLKYGTDVNMLCNSIFEVEEDCRPLHVAAKNKQFEVAKLLISHAADVNAEDECGKTPIFHSIMNADFRTTELLVCHGANTKNNPELLHVAVQMKSLQIVEALLLLGADINASDEYGRTALHFTALYDTESFSNKEFDNVTGDIIRFLLSKGANLNAQCENGTTTLYLAIQQGLATVVKTLLEYYVDVNFSIGDNDTKPLHISAQLHNKEISEMLLNRGANVNARQCDGTTALHLATINRNEEVVEVLLRFGAKVDDYMMLWDATPIQIAANNGYLEIVQVLLKFGASTDFRDAGGRTALHIASKEGHVEIVKALLNYGCDINVVCDCDDETSLDCARTGSLKYRHYDCREVISILKEHVLKMKIANLYVNNKYLQFLSENDDMTSFQIECEKEIARMKSEKIGNINISFYDILTKGVRRLAIYAANEDIVQILKSDDCKIKFPIYNSLILSNFMRVERRKNLLEQSFWFFHFLLNDFLELPYYCSEKIVDYLSDEDLRMLMCAIKEREERKELQEPIYRVLFLKNYPDFPYKCAEKIFNYLSDEDLRTLMEACEPTNFSSAVTVSNDVAIA